MRGRRFVCSDRPCPAGFPFGDTARTTHMHTLKWIILALALFQGGWLVFDGGRALIVGDYVTPRSGPRAGQLGAWSRIVSALSLEPRSTFIKCLHLFLGVTWLVAMMVFALRPAAGWWVIFGCAAASLWYLPVGTCMSIVVIALLRTPQIRSLS